MADIILPVTEEDYLKGGKFVTFPPNAKVGDTLYRNIEIGMVDWDTPGVSMKVPVTVTDEGIDLGKEDKVSFGVKPGGIWKGREIHLAITGEEMPVKKGSDGRKHPSIDPMALVGKPAVGMWQMTSGKKGGVGETVTYPKLLAIFPAGYKPSEQDELGV